jgi:hypothetical protein
MQKDAGTFGTPLEGALEWKTIYILLAMPSPNHFV